jgi:hypothetical protein
VPQRKQVSARFAVAALPFFGAFLMTYQGLFKT